MIMQKAINAIFLKGDLFMAKYETWHDVEGKDTWNVPEAEQDIRNVKRFANLYAVPAVANAAENQLIHAIYGKNEVYEHLITDAAREMYEIISNKDNATGYHINHITSGKTVFTLWNNNGEVYIDQASFATEDEAKDYVKENQLIANVESVEDADEGTRWHVFVLDEDETERIRKEEFGGEWVADFDTIEEAEAEAESLERSYIVEMPSEEWWIVIDNKTNKSAFKMMFPTKVRALAFLYKLAKPKAWMAYVEYPAGVKVVE